MFSLKTDRGINQTKNKRRSCTAICSVNGAQNVSIEHTPNYFQKEELYRHEGPDGDPVGVFQAGSFEKLRVLGSMKYDCQKDTFAFPNDPNSNRRDTV